MRYWLEPRIAPTKWRNSPRARSGREGDRCLARRQPLRAQARERALARRCARCSPRSSRSRGSRATRVPVVALHVLAVLGDERAADRVAGARSSRRGSRESCRTPPVWRCVLTRAALGIADARIHRQSGRLALARQLDGPLRRQIPGMIEIEVGDLARQRLRIDEPGVGILRRVAGDGAGLLDRLAHRRGRQVGGARRALALAEVHRHRQSPVALVLDGVDLAQAHVHRRGPGSPMASASHCEAPWRLASSSARLATSWSCACGLGSAARLSSCVIR